MSIFDKSASVGSGLLDPIAAILKNPFSTTVKNNGERPHDFPGGFQIIEYVDGTPKNDTIIRLIGNMMPFQPFTWAGEQRLVKEYYPGNPEASVQVLGPKEGDLVIKGRFKDKRYKDPSYYGVAHQYNLAINEMRKRGNLVKFGMHGMGADWFRFGFIERGEFKMNKISWIDYEIALFVLSETKPKNNFFASKEKNSPSSVNQNLINSAASFQEHYSAVPTSMPQSLAGALNGLISGIAKNINLVTNFVSTAISTAQDLQSSANRALGLIKNARANISVFKRQINSFHHGWSTLAYPGGASTQAKSTYSNLSYLHETGKATVPMSLYLAKMQVQFEAISKTVPKARYKVQVSDTLQNISIKFYGVSDSWTKIYDHNNLSSTVLVPGKILEIPKL